jgi:hypothetical protein
MPAGGGGGGALYANGTMVLGMAHANINFFNTSTQNVSIPANGTTQVNVALSSNLSGPGLGNLPQNTVAINYTFNASDAGNLIYHNSATAHTFSMNTNANVPFAVGTCITVANETGGGNVILANLTSVVKFVLAGSALSGNRNLVANGLATLLQVQTDTWFIMGYGLS